MRTLGLGAADVGYDSIARTIFSSCVSMERHVSMDVHICVMGNGGSVRIYDYQLCDCIS